MMNLYLVRGGGIFSITRLTRTGRKCRSRKIHIKPRKQQKLVTKLALKTGKTEPAVPQTTSITKYNISFRRTKRK